MADAIFVGIEVAHLGFDILQRAIVFGDLALLVGDALQLAAAGVAERAVLSRSRGYRA